MSKAVAISRRRAQSRNWTPSGLAEGFSASLQSGNLFSSVADPNGLIEPARLALALGTTSRDLVRSAGLSDDVARRVSRASAPKPQQRLREMVEIIDRVTEWAGGRHFAVAWYRSQPIAAFGGQTAEALVRAGYAHAVREYLDGIAVGGFA